jgi:hypothetical protein
VKAGRIFLPAFFFSGAQLPAAARVLTEKP